MTSTSPTPSDEPRVRVVKGSPISAEILIERENGDGLPTGDRLIWARHETHPQLDTLLVTVHYSYAYLDNGTIGDLAVKIARLLGGNPGEQS